MVKIIDDVCDAVYGSVKDRIKGSASEQELGQRGLGYLALKRKDTPDEVIQAIARYDINKHSGPENFTKVNSLGEHQGKVYRESFEQLEKQMITKDDGLICDETDDEWLDRLDEYNNKKAGWLKEKNLKEDELFKAPRAAGASWSNDPFEDNSGAAHNKNDPFDTSSSDPFADEAETINTDDWDDADEDFDEIDDLDMDGSDPFA